MTSVGAATRYTIRNFVSGIGCVACSPDGRTAAGGDENGQIFFFDVAAGERSGEPLSAHEAGVTRLAFSPDGSQLASGGGDAKVTLWDVARREPIRHLKGHTDRITNLSFSADGNFLVSGSQDGSARIWGLTGSGKPRILARSLGSNVMDVAFSRDGRWIATGDTVPRIWDAMTGRLIRTLAMVEVGIATASRSLRIAKSWQPAEIIPESPCGMLPAGQALRSLDGRVSDTSLIEADRTIGSLAFTPDGKLVAAGFGEFAWNFRGKSNQIIKIWEVDTGRLVRVLDVESSVRTLAFSPGAIDLWPRVVTMASGSGKQAIGTERSGQMSASPQAAETIPGAWPIVRRSHPTAAGSLSRFLMARSACGMPRPADSFIGSEGNITISCVASRSRPTAEPWPRLAMTRR